jgi:hypothetical protein
VPATVPVQVVVALTFRRSEEDGLALIAAWVAKWAGAGDAVYSGVVSIDLQPILAGRRSIIYLWR